MIISVKNEQLGESCEIYTHKSGIKIYVSKKPGYSSSYAIFGTRYGSIDTCFKRSDKDEFTTVPEGIAHYLEHKLFESEDGDAFTRYAKTGAMANAFTSFDRTCYLFSCSSNFEESLKILLDFVQHPYFTEETVRKEQGIIGQEISMYDDSAPWRVLFNLLGLMYHNHPVKIDIAGTHESIAQINAELLYECYNTFYNLNNMFICIAGDVDVDRVFAICDEMLKTSEPVEIERADFSEPYECVDKYKEISLPVAMPIFAIGYKERCIHPQRSVKERVAAEILQKIIFGNDSALYKKLLDMELINSSFGTEYFFGHGYASVIVEGESKDPKTVHRLINEEIERIRENGISDDDYSAALRCIYGRIVSAYNSVENTAMSMVDAAFLGEGVYDEFDCIRTITKEDVTECFSNMFDTENSALSVVMPKN